LRAGDGEVADGDEDDGGSSDRWSSMVKNWMKVVYEVVWSSSKWWQGQGCTNDGY
jgi:hypothetical protein